MGVMWFSFLYGIQTWLHKRDNVIDRQDVTLCTNTHRSIKKKHIKIAGKLKGWARQRDWLAKSVTRWYSEIITPTGALWGMTRLYIITFKIIMRIIISNWVRQVKDNDCIHDESYAIVWRFYLRVVKNRNCITFIYNILLEKVSNTSLPLLITIMYYIDLQSSAG